jgi:hypothetical protein
VVAVWSFETHGSACHDAISLKSTVGGVALYHLELHRHEAVPCSDQNLQMKEDH